MGFNEVYKALLDIFAQIDARVLRAVAIEHSKDFDAAVEAVLDDIIPFFSERFGQRSPLTRNISVGESFEDAIVRAQTEDSPSLSTVSSVEVQDGSIVNRGNRHGHNEPFFDAYDRHWEGEHETADLPLSERTHENTINLSGDVYSDGEPVGYVDNNGVVVLRLEASIEPETEETVSGEKFPKSSIKMSTDDSISPHIVGKLQNVDMGVNQTGPLKTEFGTGFNQEKDQEKSSVDGNDLLDGSPSLTVNDVNVSPLESSVQLVEVPDIHESDLEKLDASLSTDTSSKVETTSKIVGTEDESTLNASMFQSTDTASKAETVSNIVGTEDESTLNATVSQSSQNNMIDFLDEIVSDARNNKNILFSVLESVISLMRQVQLKEQAAEVAKEEAAIGGTNILNKVEELKQILKHANQANQMHTGEVYGEKAILVTELRELQARVLYLLGERDKSLGVLDEMLQSLEFRLAAAENEIKAAEQEKLEKETATQKLLADQEYIMEKVVQESKILKQQTEDNAKLQEFLVDRGRVVDMLQGEIAVICQDVKLLNEKFYETGSLSKSLSSSRVNFIKASSDSSFNSLISDQMEPGPVGDDSLQTQNEMDHEKVSEDEASGDDRKAVLDDGWDFLDDHDINA